MRGHFLVTCRGSMRLTSQLTRRQGFRHHLSGVECTRHPPHISSIPQMTKKGLAYWAILGSFSELATST